MSVTKCPLFLLLYMKVSFCTIYLTRTKCNRYSLINILLLYKYSRNFKFYFRSVVYVLYIGISQMVRKSLAYMQITSYLLHVMLTVKFELNSSFIVSEGLKK